MDNENLQWKLEKLSLVNRKPTWTMKMVLKNVKLILIYRNLILEKKEEEKIFGH